jgi:LmbE family N-acetylglucosaminyl deacetylase
VAWFYLSPHLDDAVFSCGGLIWEQASRGEEVQVWTVFAGDPPACPLSAYARGLHARWGAGPQAVRLRREEDRRACRRLGAAFRHLPFPDVIYRRDPEDGKPLVNSDADLFRDLPAGETYLVDQLGRQLAELPPAARLVCPLALGNHLDHQLVREAAEGIGRPPWYYADLPYGLRAGDPPPGLIKGLEALTWPVSQTGLAAWLEAAAAYASQIDTFWPGVEAMQAGLRVYCQQAGGIRLWRPV